MALSLRASNRAASDPIAIDENRSPALSDPPKTTVTALRAAYRQIKAATGWPGTKVSARRSFGLTIQWAPVLI